MILRNPFCHPYYRAPVVLARGSVNLATLLWSIFLLFKKDALVSSGAPYAWITNYVNEDVLAACFGVVALSQMLWLLLCLPPLRFGSIGYGILAFSWLTVWLSNLLGPHILHPTAASCVPVIAGLAFYGFISNPRSGNHGVRLDS